MYKRRIIMEKVLAQNNETLKSNKNERGKVRTGLLALATGAGALLLGACASKADTVSENLSTAAEEFEIERRIVFLNGITDNVPLVIEGRCSIEVDDSDDQLEVTCKAGEDEYEKHFLGLSDNMTYMVEQVETADVDEYRTRVLIKPEQLIPNFDLNTSLND
jgi:hypothetical protein